MLGDLVRDKDVQVEWKRMQVGSFGGVEGLKLEGKLKWRQEL